MNKLSLWLAPLLLASFCWSCQPAAAPSGQDKEAAPEDTRNLPGIGMPRGLLKKSGQETPGYVLFSPLLSDTCYLINMDGEVVHTWKSEYGPSGWAYLKENGNLLRGGRDPGAPVFAGGGQGGWLQEFTWDGELVWEYNLASEARLAHHDVAIMPNGHILAIAWEAKTVEEAIQAGRNPELIPKAGAWPDVVVELAPEGKDGARIVWEWHLWDHLVQDYDETKDNYGDPAAHPERIDINLGGPLPPPITAEELDQRRATNNASTNSSLDNRGADLYHINAIDYNAELGQIALSSPKLDEIFIIDHSTTTKEAAGNQGGRWGKGGDILYRWGNPLNYQRGDSTHQQLAGQHDVKWIEEGMPGAGNLLVFNNYVPGSGIGYSSVLELMTPLTADGYELAENGRYGPERPSWSYVAKDSLSFFAPFISGAQRLPNGHTLVTAGPRGRFFEVSAEGDILWEYWTPYAGYKRLPDGTTPQPVGPFLYATFRATHIPLDHPAVAGRELTPLAPQPPAFVVEEKPAAE